MQDRVVEVARGRQRPESRAELHRGRRRVRGGRFRRAHRDGGEALRGVDVELHMRVVDAVGAEFAQERRERHALGRALARRLAREVGGLRLHALFELGRRHDFVDEAPLHGATALDALLDRAEHVGMVAAHHALVDDAGEAARARQHRQQRHLRQRHRGRAVVDHHDVVGGQRQLVAAAGGRAVDDGDEFLAGMLRRVFHRIARLVGELAEIHLVGVLRPRQHPDVGAGAEHAVLGRAQQDDLHVRMLEAQAGERIGQFDVDAEVVGIELQFIAFEQAALLVHVHGERRHFAVDRQLPVLVA